MPNGSGFGRSAVGGGPGAMPNGSGFDQSAVGEDLEQCPMGATLTGVR